MTENEALMILNAVPGLNAAGIHRLLEIFGGARRVLDRPSEELERTRLLPVESVRRLTRLDRYQFLDREREAMARHQVRLITFRDDVYPSPLKEIADAPAVLYVKGSLIPADNLAMAVVGSRRASVYGMTTADEFSSRLSELGFTIVSGLARGIDTAAHRGSLRCRGRTLAVLGCGMSHVYPVENKRLLERVAANGAVLSEFPMAMPPKPLNFPQRNRIISGLALGTFVVEAARRSGALITSRYAMEQGREVFALPGRVSDPNTSGTHHLIQQGAKLVTCIEDILDELGPQIKACLAPPALSREEAGSPSEPDGLPEGARVLWKGLGPHPVFIDDLVMRTRQPFPLVTALLLQLEIRRMVKKLPGMFYQRV